LSFHFDLQCVWQEQESEHDRRRGLQPAGARRVRFHDLRHSHATQLLLAGVHPKVAQERLGYSTIRTTRDLYSHVTDTTQEDAAERLDDVLRPAISRAADVK
jgi:integrase